ncbi:Bestrophin-1 [Taenia solium]|eukprot:TsM_000192900 transcript=TsM_000192900 gene=TsM_000192900
MNDFQELLLKLFHMGKVSVPHSADQKKSSVLKLFFRILAAKLCVYERIDLLKVFSNPFQVVTLATYPYFLSSIFGCQFIVNASDCSAPFRRDYCALLHTILEFIVYMGWLRVRNSLFYVSWVPQMTATCIEEEVQFKSELAE